jgi:hypothetical protein
MHYGKITEEGTIMAEISEEEVATDEEHLTGGEVDAQGQEV